MFQRQQPVEILLAEDNPQEAAVACETFSDAGVKNVVHVVGDGEAALDFLYRRGDYADAARPGLVLLNIDLPRRNGRHVLDIMKNDSELKKIPVIMLTQASAADEAQKSYELQANCHVVKPASAGALAETLRRVGDFWLNVVKLPLNA